MPIREECQKILASNKSDDQKLYDIFQLVKDDVRRTNVELYYALLGWSNTHMRDLDPAASASVLADYFK